MKLLIITIALVGCTGAITLGQDDHDYTVHHILDAHENFKETMELNNLRGLDENYENGHMVENTVDYLTHVKGFSKFMSQFNRTYQSQAEYKKRYSIFTENMKKIYVLQQTDKGSAQYGPTKYSDLSEEEFSQLLGLRTDMKPGFTSMRPAVIPDIDLPTEFDWRTKGAVTPVKDQKQCGSCWAFSVTGNLEGQYAIKHNELLSFSEQELVDCDLHDAGCNGGLPETAYNSIRMLGGLDIESDYPYYGFERRCHFNKTKAKVTVTGAHELPQNEDDIAKWLVKNGPVSVGVNAGPMQFYTGGVLHPFKMLCDPKGLDHAVLIVGYGVRTTRYLRRQQPYWIIKNTWGADWGENGYVRLYRGAGTCGVNLVATSAIID